MSDTEPMTGPLSWRDVGRMVSEAEGRIQVSIADYSKKITDILNDHDTRLDSLERDRITEKAQASTVLLFLRFGKWLLATLIAVAAAAATVAYAISQGHH